MALGRPLGAKLYLEGKEIPFIGATITHTVNQASIAYIDLVPQKEIQKVKPRTHVVLAIRDYNNADEDHPFVHAWEGEVFGYSFGKTVGSRSFQIQCIDLTGYWDNVLTYFMNTQTSLGKGGLDLQSVGLDKDVAQAIKARFEPTTHSLSSYFLQVIDDVMKDESKDFLDGFVGVYKHISEINDFYNLAEKRLRIIDRMQLHSSGSLRDLLDWERSKDWFNGVIGRAGGWSTLRMVIQDLMSIIFHDFVSLPFPARVEKKDVAGKSLKSTEAKSYSIGQFIFKPNLYMVPPPVCNVFFPDEYASFQFSRNFFKEPTRLIYKPQLPLFQSGDLISLPYVFEPPSFEHFMVGTEAFEAKGLVGTDDFQVPKDYGFYNEPDENTDPEDGPASAKTNGAKLREGQFLTNEEMIKGIFMAQESMVPASTQFQGSLDGSFKRNFLKEIGRYLFWKKRFQDRSLQITSHLKMSVVPGFTTLLLDDSDAEQDVIAYCSSVTHRIYATEGGYTNVTLSYARTVGEQASATTNNNEPIVPPWFKKDIFGEVTTPPTEGVAKEELKSAGKTLVTPEGLSDFYKTLLGSRGFKAVTNYFKGEVTLQGAVKKLRNDYRAARSKGPEAVQSMISQVTSRDYIRIRETMDFIGASTKTHDLRSSDFTEFNGGAFDPKNTDFGSAVAKKQAPVIKYRDQLKNYRGFRG